MALAAFCRTRVVHPRAQLFVYYLQPPMLLAGGDSEQCSVGRDGTGWRAVVVPEEVAPSGFRDNSEVGDALTTRHELVPRMSAPM